MSTMSKYKIIEHGPAGVVLAKHVSLDRHVQLHRFPINDLDEKGKRTLFAIATNLATIDHPQIPHLLDFIQTDDAYLLVLESHPGQRLADCLTAESDVDVMRAASRAERIAEALWHAHQRGLAHGALTIDDILVDTLGQPKVMGIGMRQLHAGHDRDMQELVDRDMRSLGEILLASLPPSAHNNSSEPETTPLVAIDGLGTLIDLRNLAERLAGASETKSIPSLQVAHQLLQQWLRRESIAREARELLVEPAPADHDAAPRTRSRKPLLAACAAIGCLLTLVVAIALWPPPLESPPVTTSAVTNADPPKATAAADHNQHRSQAEQQPSSLSKVGVLNNPHTAEPPTDIETATGEQDAIESDASTAELRMGNSSHGGSASTAEKPESNSSDIKQTPAPPRQRPSDPFANVPRVISLPKDSATDVSTLIEIDLQDDDPLELNLLGGVGAGRRAEIALLAATHDSWQIISRNKGTATNIALLTRDNGALMFQWQEALASAAPGTLRNTSLHLSSDTYDAIVALRKPLVLDAIKVTLQRRMPLAIDIEPPPTLDDVFLEFVSTDGSLVSAINQSTVSALDGQLQLGLDAGKDSLILVQVVSLMKKRRGLLLIPLSRSTPSTTPVEIRKNTPRAWPRDLVSLRGQRIAWKAALRKAERGQKRLMQQRLKQLESEIQQRQRRIDAYTTAMDASLCFRIFRRIGEYEMDLVHFGARGERMDEAQ